MTPEEIIEKLGVEGLCRTAEDYFAAVEDTELLKAKPFADIATAPEILSNLGILLSGLHLTKGMTVLDFGAGSCWLTHYLCQMGCRAIAADPSATALEIGKKSFEEHPVFGNPPFPPSYLLFDGHTIDLPDASVDRIICFDAFHHVPNQKEVLTEFRRVLKKGGIAGFSEPGRQHSQTGSSQYEMTKYQVLENDIVVEDLYALAHQAGFTDFSCKVNFASNLTLTLDEFVDVIETSVPCRLIGWPRISDHVYNSLANLGTFYFHNGPYEPDSRNPESLAHRIELPTDSFSGKRGEEIQIPLQVHNEGEALWLTRNEGGIGEVRVGAHLFNDAGDLLDFGYVIQPLSKQLKPSESIECTLLVRFENSGRYLLEIDLVSIDVTWFQHRGSKPARAQITIE